MREGDHAGSIRARVFFQPDRTSDLGDLKPLSQTAVIDRLIVLLPSPNLDGAAREPEKRWPQGTVPAPLNDLAKCGRDHTALQGGAFRRSSARQRDRSGINVRDEDAAAGRDIEDRVVAQSHRGPTRRI